MKAPRAGSFRRAGLFVYALPNAPEFTSDTRGVPCRPRRAASTSDLTMRIPARLDRLCDAALALFYPLACAACGAEGVEARADFPVCAACWARTRVFNGDETVCW